MKKFVTVSIKLLLSFSNKIDFFTLIAINMSHHPFLETQTFEKKRTKMHTNEEGIFCIVIMIYLFLIHMLQVKINSWLFYF